MLAILVLASSVVLSVVFWEWLSEGESGSTTVRNIGLVLGGAVAILLAFWRSVEERSLLNERYQKGAEMLGSDLLSVRLGGIYALQRLAEDQPERYHLQIMRLFCAFVRHPTAEESPTGSEGGSGTASEVAQGQADDPREPPEDVQAVMTAIGSRSGRRIRLEKDEGYRLDLRRVDLRGATLRRAILSNADFTRARLSGVDFAEADLSGANLTLADLSCLPDSKADRNRAAMAAVLGHHESWVTIMIAVDLSGANLFCADLTNAVLRRANLSGAILVATVPLGIGDRPGQVF